MQNDTDFAMHGSRRKKTVAFLMKLIKIGWFFFSIVQWTVQTFKAQCLSK